MKKILKYIPLVIALVILYFLISPNYSSLVKVYHISNKKWLFVAFLSSIFSYFFMSVSLHEMLNIMGYNIKFIKSFTITVISTTVNYFFSSGGVSGFAIRTHLLNKNNIPISICITISVVLTAFIYLILGFIILQSIIIYFFEIKEFNLKIVEGFIACLIVFLIPLFLTIIIYNYRFRNRWIIRIFYFINRTLYQITKYQIPKEDFRDFKNKLNYGVEILHKKKFELPKVITYVLLDWIFNILVLYFAFLSIDIKISFLKLIIGFSFGMVMTIIPILPSGLGAMEFVMSGFYSNYGISISYAIFATLVFRFFYYIIPSIIGIIMFYAIKTVDVNIDKNDVLNYKK